MENRRKWVLEGLVKPVAAMVAFTGLVAVGAAEWPDHGPVEQVTTDASCSPASGIELPPPDEGETANFNNIVNGIDQTVFFVSTKDYLWSIDGGIQKQGRSEMDKIEAVTPVSEFGSQAVQNKYTAIYNKESVEYEDRAKDYLAAKGITVTTENNSAKEKKAIYKEIIQGTGPNLQILGQLEFLPNAVVEASGLKHIVVSPHNEEVAFTIPKVEGNTLYLSDTADPYQLVNGMSKMILDSCPDKSDILDNFDRITNEAGQKYGQTTMKALDKASPTTVDQRFGSVFDLNVNTSGYDLSSIDALSAENEFISIMASTILGENDWNSSQANKPVGEKQAIVQSVFNGLVPRGENYEQFMDYVDYYGYPDLAPSGVTLTEEASDLQTLFKNLALTPTKAAYNYELALYRGIAEGFAPAGVPLTPLPEKLPQYPKPIDLFPPKN